MSTPATAVKERVKELPHPLIPADVGNQTLPYCMDVQWGKVWIAASAGTSGGVSFMSPANAARVRRQFCGRLKYFRSGGGWSFFIGMMVPSALLK